VKEIEEGERWEEVETGDDEVGNGIGRRREEVLESLDLCRLIKFDGGRVGWLIV